MSNELENGFRCGLPRRLLAVESIGGQEGREMAMVYLCSVAQGFPSSPC